MSYCKADKHTVNFQISDINYYSTCNSYAEKLSVIYADT